MSLLISGKSECIPRFNLCIWCYNWWNLSTEYEMSLYYLIRTRDTRLVPFFVKIHLPVKLKGRAQRRLIITNVTRRTLQNNS